MKEMRGFRKTFNITFNQDIDDHIDNQTDGGQCGSTDDVETSALLVCVIENTLCIKTLITFSRVLLYRCFPLVLWLVPCCQGYSLTLLVGK